MNREEVLKQLQSIFRNILKKDNVCIDESSTSKDVDGWDSLTHMQIIAQIEKHFGVRFNFREVIKFKNVGFVQCLINQNGINDAVPLF